MTPFPFLPVASIDDVLAYNPDDVTTHTPSPLVNAVAEALCKTKIIEGYDLADYLQLDSKKLSHALQIEMGMGLRDVVKQYRIHAIQKYISEHPDDTLTQVALQNGYASDNAVWRLFFRSLGTTPNGRKSEGDKTEWREKIRKYVVDRKK